MPLRIERVECFVVRIPLRFPVEHALASRTVNQTGFVVLTAEDGTAGIGEFLSREYVTGETLEHCMQCLQRARPFLTKAAIDEPISFIQSLWDRNADVPGKYGALCALELALLDLWGKRHGQPVAEVVRPGAWRPHRTLVYSAVYPFVKGLKLLALHVFYGTVMRLEQVKVKGRGHAESDLAYVQRIRRAFPYPIQIRLDLNGSLSPSHADEYFSRLVKSQDGVTWFEQPFPKDAWDVARRFQKRLGRDVVLCADESVCSMGDLERAISEGAFRAVNIRIGKNGGLLHALKLYKRALDNGLETQLGCLVGESSVLAYAGLHFAALADQLRYHEGCFGTRLITWDVVNPSLTFSRGGRVALSQLPKAGLVPMCHVDRLRQHALQSGSRREKP